MCDADRKHPDIAKVIKIFDWLELIDQTRVWVFLEVCIYYWIWICMYAIIVKSMYYFLKKKIEFNWGLGQATTMHKLRYKLIFPPVFILIDYLEDVSLIILDIDTSLKEWKATFMQIVNKKCHFARYKSEIWSLQKKVYNITKQECKKVLKDLKKVRHWLYGVYFIFETDANTFVSQLNETDTDIFGALVIIWIA